MSPANSNETYLPGNQPSKYVTVKYRWVVLLVYWMSTMVTAFIPATFLPISSIVAIIYDVDPIIVNTCVSFFYLSYVLFNFVSV